MHVVLPEGWLHGESIRHVVSPNADQRPEGMAIDLVVIHGISLPFAEFGGDQVEALFTNQLAATAPGQYPDLAGLTVSAHLFVRRGGDIIQFAPFAARAWHAGVSSHEGRSRCNDFSIGIELEGTDDIPYSEAQYHCLVAVLRQLIATYPQLNASRIVGHCDIAPERKTDPGPAFDWARLRYYLEEDPHAGS